MVEEKIHYAKAFIALPDDFEIVLFKYYSNVCNFVFSIHIRKEKYD